MVQLSIFRTDTSFVAKDRQPGAGSSIWTFAVPALVVGGLALAWFGMDSGTWLGYVLAALVSAAAACFAMESYRQKTIRKVWRKAELHRMAIEGARREVEMQERAEIEEISRKALESEREALFRLQEIDKVKNDFVSSVSHELRSPLTSTLGYLELLHDGDAGPLNPEQTHMINVAARNARRLQALIEDLLTISRIESGSFRIQFRPIELHTTVLTAVQQSVVVANERSVQLRLEASENTGLLAGDGKELSRAFNNVINNAVKFTPPGGAVDVHVRRESGERVVVVVKDTGIGIPKEEQEKLFGQFYRATAAVEQQHQGAGLGLSIAKTIFEHHGGTIEVDSSAEGTTVTVSLPALPFEDSDAVAPATTANLDANLPS